MSEARKLSIQPLSPLGAEITDVDLSQLIRDDDSMQALERLLHEHGLLVFRDQGHLKPEEEIMFARHFDKEAKTVWRDQQSNPWERYKAEKLGGAGTFQLPQHPEILVLGKGQVTDHHGLTEYLGGRRLAYGKTEGSQVIGGGKLQWHIDGAFWGVLPPLVSVMSCKVSPEQRTHTIAYNGKCLECPAGATAFVSGRTAYELLEPAERAWADRTFVHYAVNPFQRYNDNVVSGDGCVSTSLGDDRWPQLRPHAWDHRNTSEPDLARSGQGKQVYPLVWRHHATSQPALMPQTRCMEVLEVLSDVCGRRCSQIIQRHESASRLQSMMARAVAPERVYAHAWRPGDVAVWDNHSMWHSATGGLKNDDRRLMHLLSWNGTVDPLSTMHRFRAPVPTTLGLPRILCLVIGQTPRDDLCGPLVRHFVGRAIVTQTGALDTLTPHQLLELLEAFPAAKRSDGGCKLLTRVRDGTLIALDERQYEPLLQRALDASLLALGETVAVAVVLCAGSFTSLSSQTNVPLLRPFNLMVNALRAASLSRLVVIVPIQDQVAAYEKRWASSGFELCVRVLSADTAPAVAADKLRGILADEAVARLAPEAVLFDYVGHSADFQAAVAPVVRAAGCVFFDLSNCITAALDNIVQHPLVTPLPAKRPRTCNGGE